MKEFRSVCTTVLITTAKESKKSFKQLTQIPIPRVQKSNTRTDPNTMFANEKIIKINSFCLFSS